MGRGGEEGEEGVRGGGRGGERRGERGGEEGAVEWPLILQFVFICLLCSSTPC